MASLSNLSVSDLRAELARREKADSKLLAERDKVATQLDALDAELADLGLNGAGAPRRGRKPGRKPGRPKGSKNKATRGGKKTASRKTGARRGRPPKNGVSLADALASAVRAGTTISPMDAAKRVQEAGYTSSSKTFGMQVANTLAKHKGFKRVGRGQYERRK